MQHVEERDEVLARDRPDGAPLAAAQLVAGRRIDEDLIVARLIQATGGGIDTGLDPERQRLAVLEHERDVGDDDLGIARFDLASELKGWDAQARCDTAFIR